MDVKNEKNNGFLAGVSFPPSSCAPSRFSRAETPFPFPSKSLPRRLSLSGSFMGLANLKYLKFEPRKLTVQKYLSYGIDEINSSNKIANFVIKLQRAYRALASL